MPESITLSYFVLRLYQQSLHFSLSSVSHQQHAGLRMSFSENVSLCAWIMAPTLPTVPPLLKERRETRRPPIGLVQGSAVYSSWQSLEIWCVDDVVLMIPGSLRWSQGQVAQKMHSVWKCYHNRIHFGSLSIFKAYNNILTCSFCVKGSRDPDEELGGLNDLWRYSGIL